MEMTVKELIEKLKEYDEDKKISITVENHTKIYNLDFEEIGDYIDIC